LFDTLSSSLSSSLSSTHSITLSFLPSRCNLLL
jgi:hypothetical protein